MEMKDKIQKKMTTEEIAAWFEWRRWCNVWRVKTPYEYGTEEYVNFKDDKTPEERQFYLQYLQRKIGRAMINRLNKWYMVENIGKSISIDTKKESESYAPYISVFDNTMNGEKARTTEEFPRGSYKDYIFHLISKKPEDAATIINGKIFHKRTGYINDILIHAYLMENENIQQGPRGGAVFEAATVSLDTPLDQEGDRTFADVVARYNHDYYSDISTIKSMAMVTLSRATREEKIILVARSYGVRISNPALLEVLHCAKEKAKNMQDAFFCRLKEEYPSDEDLENCVPYMINLCFSELSAENDVRSFLYTIKAKAEAKLNAAAEEEGEEI